jgi:hypothetical protein
MTAFIRMYDNTVDLIGRNILYYLYSWCLELKLMDIGRSELATQRILPASTLQVVVGLDALLVLSGIVAV